MGGGDRKKSVSEDKHTLKYEMPATPEFGLLDL